LPPGLLTEGLIDLSEASLANFVDYVVLHQNVDPLVTESILLLTFLSDGSSKLLVIVVRCTRGHAHHCSLSADKIISLDRRLGSLAAGYLLRELVDRPNVLVLFVLGELRDLDALILEYFKVGSRLGMLVHLNN
jgi:hypothetical protein